MARRSWWSSFVALVTSLAVLLVPSSARAEVDEVNTSDANKCPVLSGRPGLAFTVDSARRLRDAAEILLPACQNTAKLAEALLVVKEKRAGALNDIIKDLESALSLRRQESEHLRKQSPGLTFSRIFWFSVGLAVGAGATIGIAYATRGASR